jgi:sugar lactone lactonase YvrE
LDGSLLDAPQADVVPSVDSQSEAPVDMSPDTLKWPSLSLVAGVLGGPGNLDGVGSGGRLERPSGLVLDGSGNLYIADPNLYTIRQLNLATGALTTVAGLTGFSASKDGLGSAARFVVPEALASDGAGNLFVLDGYNGIRRVSLSNFAVTTYSKATAAWSPISVAFYAGTLFVDNGAMIEEIPPSGAASVLAGSSTSGYADGSGSTATFGGAEMVASDGQGNLYVADFFNSTIRKVVVSSGQVTTVAGIARNAGCQSGAIATATLENPNGVAFVAPATLYVSDTCGVRTVDLAAETVETLAGGGKVGSDGVGSAAGFWSPLGITADATGSLYVGDTGAIRKVVESSGLVSTVSGLYPSQTDLDGTGASASFGQISAAVADGMGNLYVAVSQSGEIRKILLQTGQVTTVSSGQFNLPVALAIDSASNTLYVGEDYPSAGGLGNLEIESLALGTGTVSALAGGGHGCTDGTGGTAQFNVGPQPTGMIFDGAGDLYIADIGNSALRKIVISTKTVSSVLGNLCSGSPTPVHLTFPDGLAFDPAGRIYVAGAYGVVSYDTGSGAASLIAGTDATNGYLDGTGTSARFWGIAGLALDGSGNLYIADRYNDVVRKLRLSDGLVGTTMGIRFHAGVQLGPGPASLNAPNALAMDGSDLILTDLAENVVLRIH